MAYKSWGTEKKYEVRKTVIEAFRERTGLKAIPPDRTCLALCGEQKNEPGFQIHQYISSGLIRPGQYVGVDRSEAVIKLNRERHPHEEFVTAEWAQALPELMSRRPMLIDLDTVAVAVTENALQWAGMALSLAEPGTFVAYNASMKHAYRPSARKATIEEVKQGISKYVPPRIMRKWEPLGTFSSVTRQAKMRTFLFFLPTAQEVSCAA